MPGKHALLSASSSHRWLACPPSAKLCVGADDKGSEYAQQGTDAHALCEYKLLKALGRKAENPTENLTFFDEEMDSCSDMYVQFVLEQLATAKDNCSDPIVMVEQHLDFSQWVSDGFGTGDCVIVADSVLHVIDFKYGLGVLVEAEQNPQLMCYALGALRLLDGIYDIDSVSMSIFQPRREHVSTFVMDKAELLTWAEKILAPTAELASQGAGEFKAGEHCRFCKVKATCRRRVEYNLELARYDFAMPDSLTDEEIEAVLAKTASLVNWAGDVADYALQQALSGRQWRDWKVVEGRSVRKYTDDEAVAAVVKEAGYDPYDYKVLGVTAMTKLLGRKKFEELLGGLVQKPQGRPTLVPMSDKRPAMNTAANDFNNVNDMNYKEEN